VFPSEPVIECELEAFLPRIIDIRESEYVTRDFARWVVATVFTREIYARNTERLDLLSLSRLTAPREIQELAVEIAGDPPLELLSIQLQCSGQAGNLIGGERQLPGIDPDGVYRRADSKRLTVTIGDRSAMRGNGNYTRNAGITFFYKKGVIHELETDS